MHDQKLTEDQQSLLYEKGGQEKARQTWFLGGTGSEPKTDNGRWMYDQMKEMTDRFIRQAQESTCSMAGAATRMVMADITTRIPMLKKHMNDIADQHTKAVTLGDPWGAYRPNPIDHPYLLPPASGRVYWLTSFGRAELHVDGLTLHTVWGPWDRENGRVPGLYKTPPPMKFSKPYWITL